MSPSSRSLPFVRFDLLDAISVRQAAQIERKMITFFLLILSCYFYNIFSRLQHSAGVYSGCISPPGLPQQMTTGWVADRNGNVFCRSLEFSPWKRGHVVWGPHKSTPGCPAPPQGRSSWPPHVMNPLSGAPGPLAIPWSFLENLSLYL